MSPSRTETKLSILLDGILEIGWLVAIIVTPLFFNVYSGRVFEPDKLTTLRSIALLMAAVWLTKWIEERTSGQRRIRFTWRTPLVFPTLFIIVVYLLSTVLSVNPRVSFLGSYQRLQGTYTTLAYVVVFLIILQGLRTREQLDRLITVVVLNGLPIALYGIIQRHKLDPLPWGGDVTRRVASNMGNAIFVAAYLIMIAPITLVRIVDAFRSILTDEESNPVNVFRAAAYIFILLVQLIATFYTQSRGPLMGLLAGLGMWGFLGLLILQQAARKGQPFRPGDLVKDLRRGLAFGFGSLATTAAAAAVFYLVGRTIVGSKSNLPQGIAAAAAGLAFLGLWLIFIVNRRGWRWMWSSALVIAVFAILGFLAVNPGGPFHEWSRQQPSLRRITNVLDSTSGTGMVRNLIWEGGLELFLPHEPIEFPPTQTYPEGHSDPFNALRPLVGYGPESMYVAYNSFYPPLLGHFESRTASPDRSHNETLDSLIITGVLGLAAYLWIFGSVFYFGLRWLGFLPSDWRRILFFTLPAVGATIAMAVVISTIGSHFFCLAIPVGMVGGLFLYLIVYAVSVYWDSAISQAHPCSILLIGILSAVMAHFVEINFGITIASTRTTFWAYIGAFVIVGLGLIREREPKSQQTNAGNRKSASRRRKKHRKAGLAPSSIPPVLPAWLWPTLTAAIIGGFILGTFSFDFSTNAERLSQPIDIIWRAMTVLPERNPPDVAKSPCTAQWNPVSGECRSYGALMIFSLTWVMGAVIFISEMGERGSFRERKGDKTLAAVLYLLISLAVGFGFVLVLTSRQVALMNIQAQTLEDVISVADRVADLLTTYYGFIVFVLVSGGAVLFLGRQRQPRQTAHPWSVIALLVLAVLVGAVIVVTNLQPIQADVIYKQAAPYEQHKQWLVAIEHYKRAIELVPKEDFYYLYLGRAYLEHASSLDDPAVRQVVMRETEQTLIQAREINPLNTDHSANLARMYRRWTDFASDDETRQTRIRRSLENYTLATMLSPQNVNLWNEWAALYLAIDDLKRAQEKVSYSLELDPGFDETWWQVQASIYASQNLVTDTIRAYERALEINPRQFDVWLLLGDTHSRQGQLEEAANAYKHALELKPNRAPVWRVLGSVYTQLGRLDEAVSALQRTLELAPEASDAWATHHTLGTIYTQLGQNDAALSHAQIALQLAPTDQQPQVQQLVQHLKQPALLEKISP